MTEIIYEAFAVEEGRKEGDKSRWTRIGAAFQNKIGLTVKLSAIPTNGKIVLLPPKPKQQTQTPARKPWY